MRLGMHNYGRILFIWIYMVCICVDYKQKSRYRLRMNKAEVPARKKANLSCQLVAVTMPPRRTHTVVEAREESISVKVQSQAKARGHQSSSKNRPQNNQRSQQLSPLNSPNHQIANAHLSSDSLKYLFSSAQDAATRNLGGSLEGIQETKKRGLQSSIQIDQDVTEATDRGQNQMQSIEGASHFAKNLTVDTLHHTHFGVPQKLIRKDLSSQRVESIQSNQSRPSKNLYKQGGLVQQPEWDLTDTRLPQLRNGKVPLPAHMTLTERVSPERKRNSVSHMSSAYMLSPKMVAQLGLFEQLQEITEEDKGRDTVQEEALPGPPEEKKKMREYLRQKEQKRKQDVIETRNKYAGLKDSSLSDEALIELKHFYENKLHSKQKKKIKLRDLGLAKVETKVIFSQMERNDSTQFDLQNTSENRPSIRDMNGTRKQSYLEQYLGRITSGVKIKASQVKLAQESVTPFQTVPNMTNEYQNSDLLLNQPSHLESIASKASPFSRFGRKHHSLAPLPASKHSLSNLDQAHSPDKQIESRFLRKASFSKPQYSQDQFLSPDVNKTRKLHQLDNSLTRQNYSSVLQSPSNDHLNQNINTVINEEIESVQQMDLAQIQDIGSKADSTFLNTNLNPKKLLLHQNRQKIMKNMHQNQHMSQVTDILNQSKLLQNSGSLLDSHRKQGSYLSELQLANQNSSMVQLQNQQTLSSKEMFQEWQKRQIDEVKMGYHQDLKFAHTMADIFSALHDKLTEMRKARESNQQQQNLSKGNGNSATLALLKRTLQSMEGGDPNMDFDMNSPTIRQLINSSGGRSDEGLHTMLSSRSGSTDLLERNQRSQIGTSRVEQPTRELSPSEVLRDTLRETAKHTMTNTTNQNSTWKAINRPLKLDPSLIEVEDEFKLLKDISSKRSLPESLSELHKVIKQNSARGASNDFQTDQKQQVQNVHGDDQLLCQSILFQYAYLEQLIQQCSEEVRKNSAQDYLKDKNNPYNSGLEETRQVVKKLTELVQEAMVGGKSKKIEPALQKLTSAQTKQISRRKTSAVNVLIRQVTLFKIEQEKKAKGIFSKLADLERALDSEDEDSDGGGIPELHPEVAYDEKQYGTIADIGEFKKEQSKCAKEILKRAGGRFAKPQKEDNRFWKQKSKIYSKQFAKKYPELDKSEAKKKKDTKALPF